MSFGCRAVGTWKVLDESASKPLTGLLGGELKKSFQALQPRHPGDIIFPIIDGVAPKSYENAYGRAASGLQGSHGVMRRESVYEKKSTTV
jgi:hypothetical protein